MDLKPFINFMIVLIPILLVSAEFTKMSFIDIAIPENTGVNPAVRNSSPTQETDNLLLLTAIITDSTITLGTQNGFLSTIFYREFHQYIAKDDHIVFSAEYIPHAQVLHPVTHRPMTVHEQNEIYVYAADSLNNVINAYHDKSGDLLRDAKGNILTKINIGDTVFTAPQPQEAVIVTHPDDFVQKPLSAYAVLKTQLLKIKSSCKGADDSDRIIIASEDAVLYDKIVQVMDVARAEHFTDICISRLRH